jgi:hypothetical protein
MSTTENQTGWIKARASDGGNNCVEMLATAEGVHVRDSKQQGAGPTLGFTKAEFRAWLDGAKNGEFDHLA